jgi:Cu(I)/Ag(I) efflux system membrane protein CusA/SilA
MIAALIRWSIVNRFLVLLATLMLSAWGVYSVLRTPLDALPDLSDVQVIIRTTYPGQAPRIVENQITYPLTTTMLSVPGAKTCAAIRSSATASSTCCSRTAPTCTGRARACWST